MATPAQIPAQPLSDAAIPHIGEWLADAMNHSSSKATKASWTWYREQVASDQVSCSAMQAIRLRQYVIDECETYESHGAARWQYPTPADQCDDTCNELPRLRDLPIILLAWIGMVLLAIGVAMRNSWHWLRNLD